MNEIRKRILLAAPVDRVWAFLTEPARIAEWLMDSNLVQAVEGQHFEFSAEASGSWDGKVYCSIREVIHKERISYTWNANDINQETLVTFDLEPVAGGTELILTHGNLEGAAPGAPGRHAAGWERCFKALRALLEGPSDGYDWSAFKITWTVDAPISEVYSLWSTAAGIERFWGDNVTCRDAAGNRRGNTEAFRNGDRIELGFPTGTETYIEILNIETDRFVLFSFGEDYGWVRVILSSDGTRTSIELTQFGLPTGPNDDWNVHANARGWWIANLMNIKSVLQYGNDMRVRDDGAASGLGAQYSPDGAMPDAHDWTAFDIYLYIESSPGDVIRYWQTPEGLESFFIASAQVSNDEYTWRFIHEFEVRGRFLEVSDSKVSFTFGGSYTVDVSSNAYGNGTLLHLHQQGMVDEPDDRVNGSLNCRSCWIHFMVNLKSVIEHGIDLRDQDPETTDSISVGYNR